MHHPGTNETRSAYQMVIGAYGPEVQGQRPDSIAPKCPAPCHFDDFVNYLQKGQKLDSGQRTSVGTNPWPDAVKTAKGLASFKSNGVDFIGELKKSPLEVLLCPSVPSPVIFRRNRTRFRQGLISQTRGQTRVLHPTRRL